MFHKFVYMLSEKNVSRLLSQICTFLYFDQWFLMDVSIYIFERTNNLKESMIAEESVYVHG